MVEFTKRKMDKLKVIILVFVIGVFAASFVSAGILDWFSKFTGRATSDTTSLNLTIGNTAPTITFVSTIAATDPVEDSTRTFVINFTADDDDGADDLDTAQMNLTSSGEPARYNSSCATLGSAFGNSQNYTCRVDLWYFDANAAWTINASINDSGNSVARNDTTSLTFNLLTAVKLAPTALTWPALTVTSINVGSDADPITLNNTGNDVITDITVSAIDLYGEVTASDIIYAGNFTVNTADASDNTTMVNGTAVSVDIANFTRGNYSVDDGSTGQELLYFYLEAVNPGLSSQSYSSATGGAWTIAIVT